MILLAVDIDFPVNYKPSNEKQQESSTDRTFRNKHDEHVHLT